MMNRAPAGWMADGTMDALEIFRLAAPEFSGIKDFDWIDEETGDLKRGICSFLNLYADQISRKRFGSSYDKALA